MDIVSRKGWEIWSGIFIGKIGTIDTINFLSYTQYQDQSDCNFYSNCVRTYGEYDTHKNCRCQTPWSGFKCDKRTACERLNITVVGDPNPVLSME